MTNPSLRDIPHFMHLRNEPGKRMAWVMALAVHALLAIFLIYGIRWQASTPESVSVDLVRYATPVAAEKPAAPPQPIAPEPKPQPVQKDVPREEPPAPAKAEILRKTPEKEKPKPTPTIRERAEKNFDAASEWLRRETDRMTRNRVADAAAREQARLQENMAASTRNKGLEDYLSKVRGKIRGNIVLPPAINGNPESEFVVTQLPSGEVLSVKLKKTSGNAALDAAVERAILKSSPLPKPDDPALFERELSIKYRPLED